MILRHALEEVRHERIIVIEHSTIADDQSALAKMLVQNGFCKTFSEALNFVCNKEQINQLLEVFRFERQRRIDNGTWTETTND